MEFEIGIACGQCDTYNPMGAVRCHDCGNQLALFNGASVPAAQPPAASLTPPPTASVAPPPLSATPTLAPPAPGLQPSSSSSNPALRALNPAAGVSKTAVTQSMQAQPAYTAPAVKGASRRPQAPDLNLSPTPQPPGTPEPSLRQAPLPAAIPRKQPPSYSHLSPEELMDQAKHYLCWQCYTPVPGGHKFCGRCGAEVPAEIINARTVYFSDMQNPAKARLVLIRGEGMDGLAYHLKMEQHVVGRKGQIPFPEDAFVSPKHANFFYRDGRLVVRDEGSLNGVYLRIRAPTELLPGDSFLAGEQVFRLDPAPKIPEFSDAEGTQFYTSPKYLSTFRISQMLQGGAFGMTVCARGNSLQLGREGSDLNFPADIYMSGSHCRIEEVGGRFVLNDLNSRNGTYVKLRAEHELSHGDYVFIGRKLMRVEMNS